jgi:hypothetical protein
VHLARSSRILTVFTPLCMKMTCSNFQVDDDVDLASQVLKNMVITPDPSAAVKAPKCDPAPEQSFKGEGEAIDWDF